MPRSGDRLPERRDRDAGARVSRAEPGTPRPVICCPALSEGRTPWLRFPCCTAAAMGTVPLWDCPHGAVFTELFPDLAPQPALRIGFGEPVWEMMR